MSDAVMPGPADAAPPSGPRHTHVWIWLLVLSLIGLGVFVFVRRHHTAVKAKQAKAAHPPPAVPVVATPARQGSIGVYLDGLGTVTPVYTVSLTSRVQGQIMSVNYREGQMVHKGDSLIVIDPRPFEAALTTAKGQLAHDRAVLREAKIDLDRYQRAWARNAIPKQQLDDQVQVVYQAKGTVKSDLGNLETARVNLIYCYINSPIDGRVGLRLVDPGNIVQANSATTLVVITEIQPITVIFSLSEDFLPQIQGPLSQGQRLEVTALDRTQQHKLATGWVEALDNIVDTTTGTIRIRATFPNRDGALFPNQFVNAKLLADTKRGVTLVPTAAVQRNAQGAFLYVIDSSRKATMRTVTVGTTDGEVTEVQGVNPGETVAISGFDKLREGVTVSIRSPNASAKTPSRTDPR